MKRSRSSNCSSTFPDQKITLVRTEKKIVTRSVEDLRKWLLEHWDNDESSINKLLNLLQERFYGQERTSSSIDGDQGSSALKLVKKEYRASDQKPFWWELEMVLLATSDDDINCKTFSMFIRDVTSLHEELVIFILFLVHFD